jgi:hypothetical protein
MANDKFTPLMPTPKPERTTAEQDFADYCLHLAGQMNWEPRFAKFLPKAQPDSLEAYVMTNGL